MQYYDIHSHLQLPEFDADRSVVIDALAAAAISTIVIGVDAPSSRAAVVLAEAYPHLYAAVGIHPVDGGTIADLDTITELARHPKVVAIGECGIDRYRTYDEAQAELFSAQCHLALEVGKPLMIHARPSAGTMDAYEQVLALLPEGVRGNVHFFVGDTAIAQAFVAKEFTLSYPGIITFTDMYHEVIRSIPLDHLLLETDAPFAAPAPYRGKRNSPEYIPLLYEKMAAIRGIDPELLRTTLRRTVARVFDI